MLASFSAISTIGLLSPIAGCPSTPVVVAPLGAGAGPSAATRPALVAFAVETENAEATQIASDVLRAGGNAVDAAVATALALGVTTPTACGIGGGGFAVVWRAKEQRVFVVDFRETAPAKVDRAALDNEKNPPEKRGAAIGVPGEIAGLSALVSRWGQRTWAQDVAPAIALATKGPMVTKHVNMVLSRFGKDLPKLAPEFASDWMPRGTARAEGERAPRLMLAATLQTLASQGPKVLYEGAIAAGIERAAAAVGGSVTAAELAAYKVVDREALHVTHHRDGRTREVYTMPPPSAGGLMLAQAVVADDLWRAKSGKGLERDAWNSGPYLHRVAELMRGSLDDRARFAGDPAIVPIDTARLTSAGWMTPRLSLIDDAKTRQPVELRVEEHGTSHLSIVDAEGNAVALTTTVNLPFGARVEVPGTGIMLNDQLEDFSESAPPKSDPSQATADGMVSNAPRPGARPASSMTPTIIVEGGRVVSVFGGSGGMRIATSCTLAALGDLVFSVDPQTIVEAPRIHPQGKELMVESTVPLSTRDDLRARGEALKDGLVFNAVGMITVDWSATPPRVRAGADPRKGGAAYVDSSARGAGAESASPGGR